MQLVLEQPDFDYVMRAASGREATVNERQLRRSFILSPTKLIEDWEVGDVAALSAQDLEPLLALGPELVLLGCGDAQRFPPAEAQAACLARGVGLEVMTNAAAARTFNVLAAEARKVVAGFVLDPG